MKHGHHIAETADNGSARPSLVHNQTRAYPRLNVNVPKRHREEQHLNLVRLGSERKENREYVVDAERRKLASAGARRGTSAHPGSVSMMIRFGWDMFGSCLIAGTLPECRLQGEGCVSCALHGSGSPANQYPDRLHNTTNWVFRQSKDPRLIHVPISRLGLSLA